MRYPIVLDNVDTLDIDESTQATVYICGDCVGYFDHLGGESEDATDPNNVLILDDPKPICSPCTLNFCDKCKWDF